MNERTNITINGNVTINIESPADVTQPKNNSVPQDAADNAQTDQNEPLINHDEDNLIDNETSFFGLLDVLRNCPEAIEAEKDEVERKQQEAEQERLKAILGEDYDLYAEQATDGNHKDGFKKADRRPGPVQLWKRFHRVAAKGIGTDGQLDVYTNGYAVYDNGDRRTVVWVPDCGSVTYYFNPLRDNEREYLKQKESIGEDVFGPLPWYHALTVAGEDSIERNLVHPKSAGTASASEESDEDVKPDYSWRPGGHIETPEEALLRKETREEMLAMLTEDQRTVVSMHYFEGFKQKEIAAQLGIDPTSVRDRLKCAKKKLGKNIEKIFF